MKFEIKNRWTNEVAFTADIDPPENASDAVKTSLAIKWAVAAGIALTGLLLSLGKDGYIDYCTITSGTITDCTITGGTITDCTITDCTITNCTITNCTITGCTITSGTITDCTITGCTITSGTITDCTITSGTITDCTITDCTITNCTITNCTITAGLPIPTIPKIHEKVYFAAQREEAFSMAIWGPERYDPECKTTRCRAGIVINEAGEAGYALKDQIGWEGAAWLIYKASDPTIERVPNFHATDDEALDDMKRLAEQEAMT